MFYGIRVINRIEYPPAASMFSPRVFWLLVIMRAASASLLFSDQPDIKNGVRHTWPEPRFDMFLHCPIVGPEQAPGLLQIKAIVLHHLGPCRDEVIDELVMRIIGCVGFSNGTQLRV